MCASTIRYQPAGDYHMHGQIKVPHFAFDQIKEMLYGGAVCEGVSDVRMDTPLDAQQGVYLYFTYGGEKWRIVWLTNRQTPFQEIKTASDHWFTVGW